MATERLEPDVLIGSSGVTGAVTDIQADPDTKSGSWTADDPIRATGNNTSTGIHCSFPSPTGSLTVGADLQEFRVLLRPFDSGQTGDPDWRIELWQNGGLVRAGSDTQILNDAGDTVVSLTWNANELTSDPGGDEVEIKVFGTKSGGSPGARNTVDFGAVERNVDYQTVTPIVADADITLDDATVSSDATLPIVGEGANTLAALTLSADASLTIIADATPALGALTLSSDASLPIIGDTSIAFGTLVLSSAGTVTDPPVVNAFRGGFGDNAFGGSPYAGGAITETGASADLSITFADVVLSSDASVVVTADLSISLSDLVLASDASVDIEVELAKTLDALTLSSATAVLAQAESSTQLGDLSLASAVGIQVDADLSVTLGALTLTGEAGVDAQAELSVSLDAVLLAGAVSTDIQADTSSTLGALTLSSDVTVTIGGAFASLEVTLDTLALSSDSTIEAGAEAIPVLDDIVLTSSVVTPIAVGLSITTEGISLSSSVSLLARLVGFYLPTETPANDPDSGAGFHNDHPENSGNHSGFYGPGDKNPGDGGGFHH